MVSVEIFLIIIVNILFIDMNDNDEHEHEQFFLSINSKNIDDLINGKFSHKNYLFILFCI
jgi:hypothetical protein